MKILVDYFYQKSFKFYQVPIKLNQNFNFLTYLNFRISICLRDNNCALLHSTTMTCHFTICSSLMFLFSFKISAGGLVTAVAPVVIKGKGLWVGWPGIHLPSDFNDENIPESDPSDQAPTAGLKSEQVKLRNISIDNRTFNGVNF